MVPTVMFSSFVYYAEFLGGTEKSKEDFSEIQKGDLFFIMGIKSLSIILYIWK